MMERGFNVNVINPNDRRNNQYDRKAAVQAYRKRRNKNILITVGIVGVCILIVVIWNIVHAVSNSGGERVGSFLSDYAAVIDIEGEITESSDELDNSGEYDHAWIMNTIDDLIDDECNKALIFRMNTPGGSVYASNEMYNKVMEYKRKTGRPAYVYMKSQATSGGYYISAACDKIYANRNCWTGSIGVTTGTLVNVKGLLDKLGIKAETITSGKNKAMGSPTEDMTDEQKAIIQGLVDEAYGDFVNIVAKGRKLKVDKVREIADGRIYTARQAKEIGLVDEVCTENKAIREIAKSIHLNSDDVQYLAPEQPSFIDRVFSLAKGGIKSSSELDKYGELIKLARSGNAYTVSYLCDIRK